MNALNTFTTWPTTGLAKNAAQVAVERDHDGRAYKYPNPAVHFLYATKPPEFAALESSLLFSILYVKKATTGV
jgi:hypothetical protein